MLPSSPEKAKVYFTDFRTKAYSDELPTKLKKLIKKAGIGQIDMDGRFAAIKLHFAKQGNISYLRPNYARAVADVFKELEGKPFLTDCNTMYRGSRKNTLEHLEGDVYSVQSERCDEYGNCVLACLVEAIEVSKTM